MKCIDFWARMEELAGRAAVADRGLPPECSERRSLISGFLTDVDLLSSVWNNPPPESTNRVCSECGAELNPKEVDRIQALCFSCSYWTEKVLDISDSNYVRSKGSCYRISDPVWSDTKDNRALGFGGSVFNILFFDGRRVRTNNLYTQGTILERFRDRLPDNAIFLPKE